MLPIHSGWPLLMSTATRSPSAAAWARPEQAAPSLSPSLLCTTRKSAAVPASDNLPLSGAAAHAAASSLSVTAPISQSAATLPPIPDAPPERATPAGAPLPLLQAEATVALDESYGADERALNDFLTLHPMLSFGAIAAQNTANASPS